MRDSKHFYLLIFREINHLLRSLLQKKLSESLIQKDPLFLKTSGIPDISAGTEIISEIFCILSGILRIIDGNNQQKAEYRILPDK